MKKITETLLVLAGVLASGNIAFAQYRGEGVPAGQKTETRILLEEADSAEAQIPFLSAASFKSSLS